MSVAVTAPIVGALTASVKGASDMTGGAALQIFDLNRGIRPLGRTS